MKHKKLMLTSCLLSMLMISNSLGIHTSYAESVYNSDMIIDQIDLVNDYINLKNSKITFLNDVMNSLNIDTEFKSFNEFIEFANDNESFKSIAPYTINKKGKYIYNDTIINDSDKIILLVQDNQLYVVHPNKELKDTICISTVSKSYTYNKQELNYSNLVKDKSTYIYEVTLWQYHTPLDNISYTCHFGYRSDPFTGEQTYHSGADLQASMNTPVYAVESGTVTFAGNLDDGYGNYVIIEHENNYSTLYAHCDKLLVNTGDSIYTGQIIAESGNSGRSTGPHLHFEYRQNGTPIDPSKYLEGGN